MNLQGGPPKKKQVIKWSFSFVTLINGGKSMGKWG